MSIAYCYNCDTPYDQDFNVEHESECYGEELDQFISYAVKEGYISQEDASCMTYEHKQEYFDYCEAYTGSY